MRLLALHVEDVTTMFLDRIEEDIPYALANDAGLAAVWRLADGLRCLHPAELVDQADDRLEHIAEAAESRRVRTLRELGAALGP